jgi:predicted Zn finger-like uncharacterized protein
MALATRCPNCSALFRVGAEQLRSRNGMVRCGSCRHVFNAIGRLDYVDPVARSAEVPDAPETPAAVAGGVRTAPAPDPAASPIVASPEPAYSVGPGFARTAMQALRPGTPSSTAPTPIEAGTSASAAPAPETSAAETVQQMLLADGPGAETGAENFSNTLFDAIPTSPPPDVDETTEPAAIEEAPTFLRQGAPGLGRNARLALGLSIVLLGPLLILQLALLFRADLVAAMPSLHPALSALCAPLSCTAQWPMRPEYLAVVSSELQAIPGTPALELVAVVRNRAEFPMALPAIELTLTDTLNHTVGRKVFLPDDYLAMNAADARPDKLGSGADLSLRVLFEPPGSNVAGFVAYPFYP